MIGLKKLKVTLALALALVLTGSFAVGVKAQDSTVESSDSIVTTAKTVDSTIYRANNIVSISENVNGDVYCAGQSITVTGNIKGDVLCAGQTVTIDGVVDGDVRLAGQTVIVNGQVSGNATLMGQTIMLSKDSSIGQDVTVTGQAIKLDGKIARDVVGGGESLIINGEVGRNVDGGFDDLTVSDQAVVAGNISYTSAEEANISGRVDGTVSRTEPVNSSDSQYEKSSKTGINWAGIFIFVCWIVVVSLALALVTPKKLHTVTNLTTDKAVLVAVFGLAGVFGLPILALLLAFTIIGLPLTALILLGWLLLLVASAGVSSAYLARVLFKGKKIHRLLGILLASVIVALAICLPIVGPFVLFLVTIFGLGAMLYGLRGEHEKPKASTQKKK